MLPACLFARSCARFCVRVRMGERARLDLWVDHSIQRVGRRLSRSLSLFCLDLSPLPSLPPSLPPALSVSLCLSVFLSLSVSVPPPLPLFLPLVSVARGESARARGGAKRGGRKREAEKRGRRGRREEGEIEREAGAGDLSANHSMV